jgi:hypothetical protein
MRPSMPALVLAALIAAVPPAMAATATYGSAMPAGDARPIAAVMAAAEANAGQAVKVEGRITRVCQKTGCWLMLDNAGQGVRVRTLHAFFVPKDATGRAVVHGTLQPVEASADAGREWQIVATSVVIES